MAGVALQLEEGYRTLRYVTPLSRPRPDQAHRDLTAWQVSHSQQDLQQISVPYYSPTYYQWVRGY